MEHSPVKRYETKYDRARENRAAELFAERFRLTLGHFPASFPIDYYAHRDGIMHAHIEVKGRNFRINARSEVRLDYMKYAWLWHSYLGTGVPGVALFAFTDAHAFINVADIKARSLRVDGRMDRGAPNDITPAVYIPIGDLRRLGGTNGHS